MIAFISQGICFYGKYPNYFLPTEGSLFSHQGAQRVVQSGEVETLKLVLLEIRKRSLCHILLLSCHRVSTPSRSLSKLKTLIPCSPSKPSSVSTIHYSTYYDLWLLISSPDLSFCPIPFAWLLASVTLVPTTAMCIDVFPKLILYLRILSCFLSSHSTLASSQAQSCPPFHVFLL